MFRKTVRVAVAIFLLLVVWGWAAIHLRARTEHGDLGYRTAFILLFLDVTRTKPYSAYPSAAEARKHATRPINLKLAPVASIKNMEIPGPAGSIPVRVYRPVGQQGAYPVILYYHGGGWVVGSLDSHENVARILAFKTGAVVVSVDYRLAPEHPFPAAVEDAYAALVWTAKNAASLGGDPARIAVAGDSAGGNLSAAVALMARDRGGPRIAHQALIYPAVNLADLNTESYRKFARGFFLTRDKVDWFLDQYVPVLAQRKHPHVSPLYAKSLSKLPPALIITAEFDVLRDEGEAYAAKLKQAGVPVKVARYDGVIHGFVSMELLLPEADQATDLIARELKKSFESM